MNNFYEELTALIIGSFFRVYNALGPGLSEIVYHRAMMVDLRNQGIAFETEVHFPVYYLGVEVGRYRADLVVAGTVIVEIKAVAGIAKEHISQVLYYLNTSELPVGLLFNFGPKASMRRLVRRCVRFCGSCSIRGRNPHFSWWAAAPTAFGDNQDGTADSLTRSVLWNELRDPSDNS